MDSRDYSPERFKEVAEELGLEWENTGSVIMVDFPNGFWVGVTLKRYPSLDFPPNKLVIGFDRDIEDEYTMDEVIPYEDTPLFAELIKRL